MRRFPTVRRPLLGLVLATLVPWTAAAQDLPVVKGRKVVATVQGEPITLEEFNQQTATPGRRRVAGATVDRAAEAATLDRMIDVALIAQEARRMQLDALPEIKKLLESFARVALREELVERAVKDVKADPKDVETIYRAAVREWKVRAALFDKPDDAARMAAEVKQRDFGEVAAAHLAQGKAKKVEDGAYLRPTAMDPELARAVSQMTVGTTSQPIATKAGHVVMRLEDIRYPDDPAERARAEQIALTSKRREAVTALDQALKKKYVKIDQAVLASVDYESASPGLDVLLKDRRVLAEVKGEKPVTVAELTEELKFQFFHGPQMAAERKRLNAKKEQTLDTILHRKVFRKEALRLRLDRTETYQARLREHERATLFDVFLRKVIAPTIKIEDGDLKAYYEEHRGDFTSPEMIRIRSVVFASRAAAEQAAQSLHKGADFQWVADRADGQVDPTAKGVMTFDGRPIMTSDLPEGVQRAVVGARPGDVRLYAAPDQRFYVLAVQGVVAAQPQPLEQVRREVTEKVVAVKVEKAVQEYASRLRALSDVKVYLKPS
jgi:parvulin-like peptidyl-prolyl isomerase